MAAIGLTGLASGLSNAPLAITQGKEAGANRAEQRAKFDQTQKQAELKYQSDKLKLQQQQQLVPAQTDTMLDTLKQQQQQIQMLSTDTIRKESYRTTDAYLEDGDVRHLNQFFKDMKNNPYAPQEFKNVVRVDKFRPQAEDHARLLKTLGLSNDQLDEMDGSKDGKVDWDTISKRFVVMTRPDGSQDLRDVYQFGILSGYADYASNKKLTQFKDLADIRSKTQRVANGPQDPTSYREAKLLAEAKERIAAGQGTETDQQFVRVMGAKMGGTQVGRADIASDARDILDDSRFAKLGPEQILKEDTPETRNYMDQVRRIETSAPINKQDRQLIARASQEVSSLSRAIELDPDSQGPVDSAFTKLYSYFKEHRAGRKAVIAYNSWMNQVRHDLFGSVLSTNELGKFHEAYGSDKSAMTQALGGMRELAENLQASLYAASIYNDPRVTHVRFGKTTQELAQGLQNIKARIKFYDTYEQALDKGKPKLQAQKEATEAAGLIVDKRGMIVKAPEWDTSNLPQHRDPQNPQAEDTSTPQPGSALNKSTMGF